MATIAGAEQKIDMGSVVQRGFETIRRQALGYLALAFLLAGIPAFALQYALLSQFGDDPTSVFSLTYGLGVLFTALTGYLLQAALVRSAILDLSGRPADIGGSLVEALKLILPMIGLTIVSGLAIGLGMLLLIVPGVILYLMWIVAVPVLVNERTGVIGSLGRSRDLTKGSRGRIFGLLVLFVIVYFGLSLAFTFASGTARLDATAPFASALVAAASTTLLALLGTAMLASLYVELRSVKEGATTDSLAAIFE